MVTPKSTEEVKVVIKGTPVTVGAARGRVCVAQSPGEAKATLQPGDILLTYSTDIGWTPYFSLIAGIVTEIGGTISHGAVIAREYQLPCLISAKNLCSLFRTGDTAYLDCAAGTLTRLVSASR